MNRDRVPFPTPVFACGVVLLFAMAIDSLAISGGSVAAPIRDPGFHLLIKEESSKRRDLPESQLSIFTSSEIDEFVKSQGGSMRILDQHADTTHELPVWQTAMKCEHKSLPWLLVSNGKAGYSGPLPANIAETKAIMERFKVK